MPYTDFYAKILMNLSLNPHCHDILLEKEFIKLTAQLALNFKDNKDELITMNNHSYILTFAS